MGGVKTELSSSSFAVVAHYCRSTLSSRPQWCNSEHQRKTKHLHNNYIPINNYTTTTYQSREPHHLFHFDVERPGKNERQRRHLPSWTALRATKENVLLETSSLPDRLVPIREARLTGTYPLPIRLPRLPHPFRFHCRFVFPVYPILFGSVCFAKHSRNPFCSISGKTSPSYDTPSSSILNDHEKCSVAVDQCWRNACRNHASTSGNRW
jgi:hypothetical protein